jgi:peptidoglycan/LPS O-acetylase OafA/YrhL
MSQTPATYRKEIDGLRAIAVLSVVLCHAGYGAFRGGFVGVDVFFVISGYLITSIIYRELSSGNFSLLKFYERRVKRILPALFAMLLFSWLFAWLCLWPADFRSFSKGLPFVSWFGANIHFQHEIGYFDPDVALRPLLHTWSLGVEEQYYLLFPFLLMLMFRFGKNGILLCLAIISMASLFAAQFWLSRNPSAVFYFLPFRAWELLIGAIYALVSVDSAGLFHRMGRKTRSVLGCIGILAILVAVVMYSEKTPFPGLSALLPTLGALLIIATAQPDTLPGKLLSIPPMQAIGLWSYSIYLWHQPIFAFTRYQIDKPTPALMAGMVVLTLVLSYASWRWIEIPLRHRQWPQKSVWLRTLAGILFFTLIGVLGKSDKDYFKRFSPDYLSELTIEKKLDRNYGLDRHCDSPDIGSRCQTADNPDTLVWGDSYAMHIVPGIIASQPDIKLMQRTMSACGPLLGIAPILNNNIRAAEACLRFNTAIMQRLPTWTTIKWVALSSKLTQYLGEGVTVLSADGRILPASADLLSEALQQTVERITATGKRAVIFSPPPATGDDLGKCLAHAARFALPLKQCDFAVKDIEPIRQQAFDVLRNLSTSTHPVLWLTDGICNATLCQASHAGIFIFRDEGHLSIEGSRWLGQQLGFRAFITGQ